MLLYCFMCQATGDTKMVHVVCLAATWFVLSGFYLGLTGSSIRKEWRMQQLGHILGGCQVLHSVPPGQYIDCEGLVVVWQL